MKFSVFRAKNSTKPMTVTVRVFSYGRDDRRALLCFASVENRAIGHIRRSKQALSGSRLVARPILHQLLQTWCLTAAG